MELAIRLGLTTPSRGLALDPDAAALVSRMTTPPSEARQTAIDTCIKSLKSAGIWSKLDSLQVYAAHNAQASLLDWVNSSRAATATATFSTDVGYLTSGGTVVNLGFGPSSPGLLQSLNDVSFGFFSTSTETTNTTSAAGAWDTTTGITIAPRNSDGTAGFRVNQFANHPTGVQNFTPNGLWTVIRSGSPAANSSMWQNGTFRSGNSATSLAIPSTNFFLGGITASGGSTKTYNAAFSGRALTGTEIGTLNTILRAYLTAVGAI
jgi:hypothetical protein